MAPTVALAPPPRHPLVSPRSWQGQQPLLQHLQRQLCHSELPWSVAQRAWRGFPSPLPKSRGWIWFRAGTLVRQCPCKVTWWSRGVTPHNSYPALIWGYLHPIPVRASEELQQSHSARCRRLCPWHSWLVPLFLVIAHHCTVMLGSQASPATGGGFPPPCSHLSPFPHPWCCAAVTRVLALAAVDGWELGFLTVFDFQPILPGVPAWSGISPSLFLPTSWCQARGNPTGKGSTGLIKPWGYSQWLVQTEGWAMAEVL